VLISADRGQLRTMRLLPFTAAADETASVAGPRHDGYVVDGQSRDDYWSSLNRRNRQGMLSEMQRSRYPLMPSNRSWTRPGPGGGHDEDHRDSRSHRPPR
jgi:hypothetical protein